MGDFQFLGGRGKFPSDQWFTYAVVVGWGIFNFWEVGESLTYVLVVGWGFLISWR